MENSILEFNSPAEIKQAAVTVRQTFNSGCTLPLPFRLHQLEQLWKLLDENEDLICEAVYKDVRKSKAEVTLGEILHTKEEVNKALVNLETWAKDEKTKPVLVNRLGTKCFMRKQPKGAVMIISPWNYPVYLLLAPFVGAIAAGCTVIMKPSESAPNSAKLLTKLVRQYLDTSCYIVINGAVPETTQLLEYKWDHIFFTGSIHVGKIIMKAASKHLTPVTLELGGKSPVIIDENADINIAAKRIIYGKLLAAGQTCIAPDYVLITSKAEAKFVEATKEALISLLGENPKESSEFARIVNEDHFKRLIRLLEEDMTGEIVIGGQVSEDDLYIAPTVIKNVGRNDGLMMEEIFGPILPMIRVSDTDEAIEYINAHDEPLTLYLFSDNKKLINKVLNSTRSGGVLVNNIMTQIIETDLPFGGLGPSGMGSYHGRESFNTFTHTRSVMVKSLCPVSEIFSRGRYPPFSDSKIAVMRAIVESVPPFKQGFIRKYFKWIVAAALFGIIVRRPSYVLQCSKCVL
ncbi:hypothetical protein BX616_010380 [Lobosporangium transversale]|uniref:Aldehyde dehydrogenase n=1 Tax=Lobosporangium transversale TaxID=64571 RepID=A0A1Y2H0V8_9FUNG|nr:aldehyde dehydrogenase family 3 member B1-like protein [Lobosporangium transversale]KAF9912220.1 hypothetical protein BX616_010380 [Lobosporangium transversale]ORZ28189.1 aldehyde dehydrogenase family 3 member B1-like protein [Lobosporangium transversale]|eukprot:XP_021885874.1 aldehyde dehydrogenase family 3 member B1-like protein [Lobosporangium transversale]